MPKLLLPKQQYLSSGIHIGMKVKTENMKKFIYKVRGDGLAIIDLKKIDERIRVAAKFLARAKKILLVSRKAVAYRAIKKLGEIIGAKVITGRFPPGMLTNPNLEEYFEPDVILISDPIIDEQALEEAVKAQVPIISFCNTIHETKFIDLIIPMNNQGRKSIALACWLLAREILKERGEIKSNKEFKYKLEDFMSK